jgi:hypothetical protein
MKTTTTYILCAITAGLGAYTAPIRPQFQERQPTYHVPATYQKVPEPHPFTPALMYKVK